MCGFVAHRARYPPSTPVHTHPTHPNTPAVYFVLEFDLVERKELAPLEELISSLCVGAAK